MPMTPPCSEMCKEVVAMLPPETAGEVSEFMTREVLSEGSFSFAAQGTNGHLIAG